jgi:protein-tyrosine phosphatase
MNATEATSTRVQKIARIVGWTLLVTILIGYTWKEHIEDRIIPKRWGVVEQASIYRSGQLHPALIERVLVENEIEVIVDLNGKRMGKTNHEAEDSIALQLGIDKKRYPLNGNGTGDIEQYALAIKAISNAVNSNKPVLVHCSAGSQRTGGVLAMYRVLVQKRAVGPVLEEMERYDWDPVKDQVLLVYLDQNIETLATRLKSMSVIEEAPSTYPSFQVANPASL